MVNPDRAWARVAPRYPGKSLRDFRLQVIIASYTIGSGGTSQNNPVVFGAGAIILGIIAACQVTGQAGTAAAQRIGLDNFSTAITYQADNRSVAGTTEGIGSSVFGPMGDQLPAVEIVMPQNTSLVYNFTNLVTNQIQITVAHHCLLPGAIG